MLSAGNKIEALYNATHTSTRVANWKTSIEAVRHGFFFFGRSRNVPEVLPQKAAGVSSMWRVDRAIVAASINFFVIDDITHWVA